MSIDHEAEEDAVCLDSLLGKNVFTQTLDATLWKLIDQ